MTCIVVIKQQMNKKDSNKNNSDYINYYLFYILNIFIYLYILITKNIYSSFIDYKELSINYCIIYNIF
jgi:hypothetical protein